MARLQNDFIADTVRQYPDRFIGLGTVPLQDVDRSIRELDRCIHQLGLKGIEIGTNINGQNLDDPAFLPFFESCAKWDVPLFVHPWETLGRERMPRLDQGWNVWPHLRVTEQPPSFYTKNFYFDSLSYEPLNIRLLLERFGHEMRDTVYCEVKQMDEAAIRQSVLEIVEQVQAYVPGYRLKQEPLFEENRVTVFLEVEGAGDYFPPYAGNLDIMTAAAVRVGEEVARHLLDGRGVSLGTK
ncbi:hypothetical protein BAG01nite_36590 [Brevibacillus agri]|uniref:Amidohydrolase-related domain-containing protein n=2 Tax=Brevibacillus agri TaxID=51101 RepID=A0A3M8A8Y5_9BACL|nr:amidohydrolase family protein [Brevibacillus agri]QAV14980.1 hypothetical protein BA6348_20785 [Brevibacillus agri]RNB47574.1 hypothetical protein EB820_24500 [Brevibacillus agri]GED27557.1 hypothetical protein BAG01nite_36590 [Brevibacillus agri]